MASRSLFTLVPFGQIVRISGISWTDLAEVDGNRTRRTGIARPARFEGGGAHQALGHLQDQSAARATLFERKIWIKENLRLTHVHFNFGGTKKTEETANFS